MTPLERTPPPAPRRSKASEKDEWAEFHERWLRTSKTTPELAGPHPGSPEANVAVYGSPRPFKPLGLSAYLGEGFRHALAEALRKMRSVPQLAERAAVRYSHFTGEAVPKVLSILGEIIREVEEPLAKQRYAPPTKLGEKIVYGLGKVPVQVAEFATIERVVRNPVLSWAIIDALDEAEHGLRAAAIGAGRGALMGTAFQRATKMERPLKRAAVMGAAGAATGLMTSDPSVSGVAASTLVGAALGALPQMAGRKPPERKIEGVVGPPPDIGWYAWYFGTPTQWLYQRFPEFQELARAAAVADDARRLMTSKATLQVTQQLNRLIGKDVHAWDRLVDYLDDPVYNLQNLPKDTQNVQEAYKFLRGLFEDYRKRIRDLQSAMGIKVSETWGLEGYFPHYHAIRGIFAIRHDGKLIPTGAFADSFPEALAKRDLYIQLRNAEAARYGTRPVSDQDVVVEWIRKPQLLRMLASRTDIKWARTMERKMNLPGWRRGPDAIINYINQAEWYLHMTPIKRRGREMLLEVRDKYGPNLVSRFERYLESFSMPHGEWFARVSAKMLEKGWDPRILSRALGTLRVIEMMAKLGFSPASALTNLAQTVTNTLPVLGPRWTAQGIKAAAEYFAYGKHAGVLEKLRVIEMDTKAEAGLAMELMNLHFPTSAAEKVLKGLAETASASMFLFSKAELANRSVAGLGAYLRAMAMGIPEKDALVVARNVIDRTQFNFSRFDSPYILSNDVLRTVFQFKTYMIKQIEFMLGLTRPGQIPGRLDTQAAELGRFLAALGSVAGVVGMPFAENFNELIDLLSGESPLDDIRYHFPRAARGLPGLIGLDLSRRIGYGDWLSIQVSGTTRTRLGALTTVARPIFGPGVVEAIMVFDVLLQPPGLERDVLIARLKNQFWPTLFRPVEVVQSNLRKSGIIRDYRGYPILTDATASESLLYALGFNPIRAQLARERYWRMKEDVEARQEFQRGLLNRYREAVARGDQAAAEQVLRDAAEHGIAPGDIIRSWRRTKERTEMIREEYYYQMHRRRVKPEHVPERFR